MTPPCAICGKPRANYASGPARVCLGCIDSGAASRRFPSVTQWTLSRVRSVGWAHWVRTEQRGGVEARRIERAAALTTLHMARKRWA